MGFCMTFRCFSWELALWIPALWDRRFWRNFFFKRYQYMFFDTESSNMVAIVCLLNFLDSKIECFRIGYWFCPDLVGVYNPDRNKVDFGFQNVVQTNIWNHILISCIKEHICWTSCEKIPSQSLIPQSWNPHHLFPRKPPKRPGKPHEIQFRAELV